MELSYAQQLLLTGCMGILCFLPRCRVQDDSCVHSSRDAMPQCLHAVDATYCPSSVRVHTVHLFSSCVCQS
jgi:hypothetical protein